MTVTTVAPEPATTADQYILKIENVTKRFGGLVAVNGDWPGIGQEVQRLKFLIFGMILVMTMLLRPQGLIPSRVRQQELTKGVHEDQTLEDVTAETTA